MVYMVNVSIMSDSTKTDTDPASDLVGMRQRIEEELDRSLSLISSQINTNLDVQVIHSCLLQYLKAPGKRLRPLLFLTTIQALNPGHGINSSTLQTACGLEFFHEFILIHDDLIDGSVTRRGAPTLWRRLESEAGLSAPKAKSAALIIGDILFAHAIELFTSNNAPPRNTNLSLVTFLGTAHETGWGAIGELMASDRSFFDTKSGLIEAVYYAKTTRYTFEAPMILAAVVCRVPDSVQATLAEMARPLGLAFQLENDLHEITHYLSGQSAKSADAEIGIKTLPLIRLLEALPDCRRHEMAGLLDQPDNDRRRERLAVAIRRTGLVATIESEIEQLFEEPRAILDQSGLDANLRSRFDRIVEFIRKNRNHSEA
jgi:geranylgeranyl diphosphate synthase type I